MPDLTDYPAPLVVLSPPRSFSSLISAMLGAHPQSAGLPELQLFMADEMDQVLKFFALTPGNLQDGLLRSVAQLYFGDQTDATVDQAKAWLAQRRHMGTGEMFRTIARKVAPQVLVEKSIATVWRPLFLRRLCETAPHAKFLHLVRHPRGQCSSLVNMIGHREDTVANDLKDFSTTPPTFDPQLAWLQIHQNILRALDDVPSEQVMRVRGEDVLADPERYLAEIATWAGMRADAEAIEAMLHPERSIFARLGPPSAPYGSDPKFLENPVFRPQQSKPQMLDGPLPWRDDLPGFVGDVMEQARAFGYR